MEQGDDCAFEFRAAAGVDCGWGEGLPDDGFADVCCNEEGDTTAQAIALLQELVEQDDDQASKDKLHDEQKADASAEVAWLSV